MGWSSANQFLSLPSCNRFSGRYVGLSLGRISSVSRRVAFGLSISSEFETQIGVGNLATPNPDSVRDCETNFDEEGDSTSSFRNRSPDRANGRP